MITQTACKLFPYLSTSSRRSAAPEAARPQGGAYSDSESDDGGCGATGAGGGAAGVARSAVAASAYAGAAWPDVRSMPTLRQAAAVKGEAPGALTCTPLRTHMYSWRAR